jgi:hypothetical protein
VSTQFKFRRSLCAVARLVLCLVFASASVLCAQQPRIQGSYAVRSEWKSANEVHLTLELSLFNCGDADLTAARLVLQDSLLIRDYGAFPTLSIAAGKAGFVRSEFTIPLREYDLWQKGRRPNFLLETESGGRERRKRVILAPSDKSQSNAGREPYTQTQTFSLAARSLFAKPLHVLATPSVLDGMSTVVDSSSLINSIAGDGPNNIPGLKAGMGIMSGVTPDSAGSLYITDFDENRVYRIDAQGVLTIVAGDGFFGYIGDSGPALLAELINPYGLTFDSAGNLLIADIGNQALRKIDASGIISTVATFNGYPTSVAVASSGDFIVALTGANSNFVVKIDSSGTVTTLAGTGVGGFGGDGGPATSAVLSNPTGVALDSSGNIYIADSFNSRIRKIDSSGIITTVAGTGIAGCCGDGGPATSATLNQPSRVLLDSSGNLYVADFANNRIRKVDTIGVISTIVGTGTAGYSGDGGPAASAELNAPFEVSLDSAGDLFISDINNFVVRKVSAGGTISTLVGNHFGVGYVTFASGIWGSFGGDGGAATGAEVNVPGGVAVDSSGNVFIADGANSRIRKVDINGIITTVAGGGSANIGDGGPATNAQLGGPTDVGVDRSGNLLIADYGHQSVRKVDSNGIITTIADSSAGLSQPLGVAADNSGAAFVVDRQNNRVFRIEGNGTLTVIAGNGIQGYMGDGGPATSAELSGPSAIAFDPAGNLYIADWENSVVRKVDPSGTITTFAGGGSTYGDGGPATSAQLASPLGVAADGNGDVFIADGALNVIRKVDPSGIITTVVGSPIACFGCAGFAGDGGPATSALLNLPSGIAVNSSGDLLYIADLANNRIRAVFPMTTGFVLSVTENGTGTGTVVGSPPDINCGRTCSTTVPPAMVVTLEAYPAAGSSFAGWSTCSGLGSCSVTMNSDQSITASFNVGPPPDFSLKAGSPNLTLQPGGQTTDVITVASQNGTFGSLVQLSCAVNGSAPLPTCSLSATSVTPGASSATSTLTINAPAQSAQFVSSVFYAALVPIPVGLSVFGFRSSNSKQRKRGTSLLCSLIVAFVALQAGCGGGSSAQQMQPQIYTVTITGASGAITHTAEVTLTVQ